MKSSKFLILIVCTSLSTYAMQQGFILEEHYREVTELYKNFEKEQMPTEDQVLSLQKKNDELKSQSLRDAEKEIQHSLRKKIQLMSERIKSHQRTQEESDQLWSRYW